MSTIHHPEPAGRSVYRVVSEELTVAVDLPSGWELEFDETRRAVIAVGSGTRHCVRDLCPSITVQKLRFLGSTPEFERLARESLAKMPGEYQDFTLRWSEETFKDRALRCYSFRLAPIEQVVIQIQGLVQAGNAAAVYVVGCSAPEASFGALEPLFRRAVASLEPLGPDYVASPAGDDSELGWKAPRDRGYRCASERGKKPRRW